MFAMFARTKISFFTSKTKVVCAMRAFLIRRLLPNLVKHSADNALFF